jgi:hypothetical protein
MNPQNPNAASRTRVILEDLEAVRENLLELSDDIWSSIDHNDADALEAGVEFKRAYNAKVAAFDVVASELSQLIQQYTSVRLEATEQSGTLDDSSNERIIAELDREIPHTLDEDFTFKRPFGFVLDGQATTGLTTWQRLYELVCANLIARDEQRMRSLYDHPDFVSNRGNRTVEHDPAKLRKALRIADGLYIESNLSANSIRDVIRRLLQHYEIRLDQVRVYLRQDRDADQA